MSQFVDGLAIPLLKVGAAIPGVILKVTRTIQRSVGDGKLTADEAEAMAKEASEEAGDLLAVKVHGEDIVDQKAQDLLFEFVGRVAYNAVTALRRAG